MNDFLAFRKMITPMIITIVFYIGVAIAAIDGLLVLAAMTSQHGFVGFLGGVIAGILVFAFVTLMTRIWCELIILLFRIYDELVAIRTGKAPGTATGFDVAPTPSSSSPM